jgi:hypothetical protein
VQAWVYCCCHAVEPTGGREKPLKPSYQGVLGWVIWCWIGDLRRRVCAQRGSFGRVRILGGHCQPNSGPCVNPKSYPCQECAEDVCSGTLVTEPSLHTWPCQLSCEQHCTFVDTWTDRYTSVCSGACGPVNCHSALLIRSLPSGRCGFWQPNTGSESPMLRHLASQHVKVWAY